MFRSTDGGSTWAARVRNTDPVKINTKLLSSSLCSDSNNRNQGFYDNVIAVDPLDPNRVWAGGIFLFRSDDGGANWNIADKLLHPDQHIIVFHPKYNGAANTVLFVGNDGGVFKTDDGRTAPNPPCADSSVVWSSLNNNYGVTQFYYGLPYPDGKSYFGGTQDNGTIRGTDSRGINGWKELFDGDGGYVAVDPTNTDVIYIERLGLIYKSTTGGIIIDLAMSGLNDPNQLFIRPLFMDPTNSKRLWTGGKYIWRTTDGARNWVQAGNFGPLDFGPVQAIAVAPSNPNNILVGLFGPIAHINTGLTSDADTVWPLSFVGTAPVSSLAFDPTNANIAYATYGSFKTPGFHSVYKTTDGGASWIGIDGSGDTALPDIPVNSIVVDPTDTSRLYVGTDLGVFVSLDGGANWAQENTGFANVITVNLAISTTDGIARLFAFTHGRGAWRVRLAAFAPQITASSVAGKKLIVTGNNFDQGAVILLNGERQKTKNDAGSVTTRLIAKKSGKKVKSGDRLQVINSDGTLSNEVMFTMSQ